MRGNAVCGPFLKIGHGGDAEGYVSEARISAASESVAYHKWFGCHRSRKVIVRGESRVIGSCGDSFSLNLTTK